MTEVFSDGFTTSLTAAIVVTTRPITLSVAATSPDLAGGTFSIVIYDAGTDANPTHAEILKVTDGSTTTWSATTEAGHTATTHASGSTVRLILTRRSLTQQMLDHTTQATTPDPHSGYLRKAAFGQKGDVLVATASGTFVAEHVGANGTVPIADSTQPSGRRWGSIGLTGVLTHMGDLIVGGLLGVAQRLGIGTVGQVLSTIQNNATVTNPSAAPTVSATGSGGTLTNGSLYDFAYAWSTGTSPDGGTTQPSPIQSFTATSTGVVAVQAPAAPVANLTLVIYAAVHGATLKQQGTLPNASTSTTNTINVSSNNTGGANASATNTTGGLSASWTSAATGTVTSVGVTMPAEFGVLGSPVTGAGTIAITKPQSASAAVAAYGTVPSNGLSESRVAPGGPIAGLVLEAGTYDSQEVWVVNESVSANSVTFAMPASGIALTGTVSKTAGSSTLTGSGTSFTTQLATGQTIIVPGGGGLEVRTISAIASNTSLTVSSNYAFTAGAQTATTLTLTGTVAKTSGSSTLTGTSTLFLSQVAIGQLISVPGVVAEIRRITAIATDTSLTVDTNFANTSSAQTAALVSSNVADGTAAVVPGALGFKFVWDSVVGLWFHTAGAGASGSVMGASGGSHAAGLAPDPGGVAGTTRYLREDATWTNPLSQSASAPAITNGATITTASVTSARVAPAGAVTGIILQVGTFGGQEVWVVNESTTANSVTFAVSGTSHVADGVNAIVPGLTAFKFVWDSSTSLWYRASGPADTPMGASGASHSAGDVPDPGAVAGTTKFLREDASWNVPPTMVASGASHAPGYAPDPGASAGSTKFLREDATWQVPAGGSGGGSGAPGGSVVPIQTQTPSGVSSVTFQVPTGFKNLRFTGVARSDAAVSVTNLLLQFNGDTGTNYNDAYLVGLNNTFSSGRDTGQTSVHIANISGASALANTASAFTVIVPNHGGTTFFKHVYGTTSDVDGAANTAVEVGSHGGYWANTGAITSIVALLGSGSFVAGSTITLWGEADIAPVLLTSNSNLIQETILTAAQATISISSIPQGYKDVRIVVEARSDTAANFTQLNLQLNGDGGSNYDWQRYDASANTNNLSGSYPTTSGACGYIAAASDLANRHGLANILLADYAGAQHKSWIAQSWSGGNNTNATSFINHLMGSWRNTGAVTSITLIPAAGNFIAGTVVRVYGEPAAAAGPSVGTGTRTRISANQSIATATATVVTWNTNDQDSDNQHLLNPTPGALTGTVTKTAASNVLVGSGTTFTTQVAVGQLISVPGTATEQFVVIAVTDNTHLTVAGAGFANTSAAQTATTLNTAIVFRQPGMFSVDLGIYWAAMATGNPNVAIRLNGTTVIAENDKSTTTAAMGQNLTTQRPFQQWDYIEAVVTQASGGAINVTADERTHFAVQSRPTVIVAVPYVCIQEQQASGTASQGTFTSGAFRTRTLNTIVSDSAGISVLSVSNQITLPPGTYRCAVRAPAQNATAHQSRLQNITDSTTLLTGSSGSSQASSLDNSFINGRFVLTGTKVLEVQHRFSGGAGGPAASFGTEIYTTFECWKEG